MTDEQPLSEQAKAQGGGCAQYAFAGFGLLFAIIGFVMLAFFVIIPAYKKQISADWPKVECKITQAEIVEHEGEDSTSYSVDFRYHFSVDGRHYSGDRYSFVDASGRLSVARRLKKEFPVGSTRECFYDPKNPSDCVLDRTNSDQTWLSIILPSAFAAMGTLFFFLGIFAKEAGVKSGSLRCSSSNPNADSHANLATKFATNFSTNPATNPAAITLGGNSAVGDASEALLDSDRLDDQWSPPRKLKPTQTRMAMFVGLTCAGLFWNGILSVFFLVPGGPIQGGGWMAIGFSLFMIPFLLVGGGLILGAGYYFLAMFNPKVEVALSTGAVPLGGDFDVAWEVEGKIERIKKLTIEVEAVQLATYQRGTDTRTDVEVFELLPVAEVDEPAAIAFGNESVNIPANSMHSFEAPRNEIKWKVVVRGEIPWAPDIQEEFEFRVTPNFDAKFNRR